MAVESANRLDGGFYVCGKVVFGGRRASTADDGGVVCMFTDLALEQWPNAPWDLANTLNDQAGLPRVALPKALREKAPA